MRNQTSLASSNKRLVSWGVRVQTQMEAFAIEASLTLAPTYVGSDTAIDVTTNPVIVVDSTLGTVNLTLFASSTQKQDGLIHRYWVHHLAGANPVNIAIAGGEPFADGLTVFVLPLHTTCVLGNMYAPAPIPGWLRISCIPTVIQAERVAAWPAASFAAPTAVPFDQIDTDDNPAVLDWNVGQPTRIVVNYTKRAQFFYHVSIDSTGGATWNLLTWLRLTPTVGPAVDIPGTTMRTGNFGLEDQSVSLPPVYYPVSAGDYVELMCDQNSLTGNMVNATIGVVIDV